MSHDEGPEAPNNLHGAQNPGSEGSDDDFPGFPDILMKLRSLRLKKVGAEAWLRCAARKLSGVLQGQPSWHELTSLVDEFDHRKSKWVELDDAVQDLIENPEEVKRLELLKFGGKITEWMLFWDQFEAIVDDKPMPPVIKFMYLRSVLEGEARRVIQGLAQTAANYNSACELLKERYAKPNKIISAHIQDLMQLALSRRSKYDNQLLALRKLQDDVIAHVRSLEALGVGGDQYGLVLAPMILSLLPHEIRLEWSRSQQEEGDLKGLLEFLQREVEGRERAEALQGLNHRKTEDPSVEKRQKKLIQGSASALQTSSEDSASKQQCAFCGKLHPSDKCFGIVKLTLHEREKAIRGKRLCLKCLSPGHYARGCWARCSECKGGHHHALICRKSEAITPVTASEKTPEGEKVRGESESVTHVGVAPCESRARGIKQCCVLQTAKIKVVGYQGIISATVMFDTGSDRSYISKDFVKRVRPKWLTSEYLSFSAFGGGKASKADLCSIYEVMSLGANNHKYSFKVAEINVICPPLCRTKVDPKCLEPFAHLNLADEHGSNRKIQVDMLIGLDLYWKLMLPNKIVCHEGLVAQETVFGWVLSGSSIRSKDNCDVGVQLLTFSNFQEDSLSNFWDLESVGIQAQETRSDAIKPDPILVQFEKLVSYKEGRYEVALPWKSESVKLKLLDNKHHALRRLDNLSRKLDRDPGLQEQYYTVFEEYEKEGIIEEIPPHQLEGGYPVFYLPHRPVVREASISTEIRPVFDGSARGSNGVSLNDCLESGPSLNPDLVEVLLRFRRWKVALTADITKAFLQIKRYPPSEVVSELLENLYVDDWLSGADSPAEACARFDEACGMLKKAGMCLSKCTSNYKTFPMTEDSIVEGVKVLGLQWDSSSDCFTFKVENVDPFGDINCPGEISLLLNFMPLVMRRKGVRCFVYVRVPEEGNFKVTLIAARVESDLPLFEFSRWSSFPKALNIVGWVLRFVGNCKASSLKAGGPLTYGELMKAKVKLLYCAQREAFAKEINALALSQPLPKGSPLVKLDPYLDEEGLLRIKGRLENAELSFESKHPIIVPGTYIALLLVHFQHGLLKHAGVAVLVSTLRNNYWIIRLRQIAKRVCRECVACRRCEAKACSQPVAPLPELRVKSAPPFTVTGLDFAGPLFCVDFPSKKLYILLFTCAVVRAVHLELTESLSVTDCNLAIRRFLPDVVYLLCSTLTMLKPFWVSPTC
ncbi:uncharacterized protein [Macrobrachium rosenbergii]|uniref:uncharacterized protein n=1 Tax=Macrobrachium rosenbergii TaxID=79674 RepID=UPI0034D65DA1